MRTLMKLAIWIFLLSFIVITDVMACEDITMTPSKFYSLAGRQQCYDTIQSGCSCIINDGERRFIINQQPTGCHCGPVWVCYDENCVGKVEQIWCDYCPEVNPAIGGEDGLLE